jgi:hypothetical protein
MFPVITNVRNHVSERLAISAVAIASQHSILLDAGLSTIGYGVSRIKSTEFKGVRLGHPDWLGSIVRLAVVY